MIDYRNYFCFFDACKDLFDSYKEKKEFIDAFYHYHISGRSYPFLCTLFNQTKFYVDLSNELGREIFMKGFIEDGVTELFYKNIKPGDGFIDCGAHMGFFSKIASQFVVDKGKVIAIEPNKQILEIFKLNFLNELNVELINAAVSDSTEPSKLQVFGPELSPYNTIATIPRSIKSDPKKIINVESVLLSDIISKLLSSIGRENKIWIKLDIEGLEQRVISSSIRSIVENNCNVVFEGSFDIEENRSLFELFKSNNYSMKMINGLSPDDLFSPANSFYFFATKIL